MVVVMTIKQMLNKINLNAKQIQSKYKINTTIENRFW